MEHRRALIDGAKCPCAYTLLLCVHAAGKVFLQAGRARPVVSVGLTTEQLPSVQVAMGACPCNAIGGTIRVILFVYVMECKLILWRLS